MVRENTKDFLTESFLELAAHKAVDKITIADITKNCGMTNTTFYRYFKDKYDLISWIYTREIQKHKGQIGQDGYTWEDLVLDMVRFLDGNRSFMVNALRHTSGNNSFIIQVIRKNLAYTAEEIREKRNGSPIPDELMAVIKIYCYGAGQYICEWLTDEAPVSCEALTARIITSVPTALHAYLYE